MLRDNRALLVPSLVCAGICIAMTRLGGVFSLFFFVPLGFSAVAYGAQAAWASFAMAMLGNLVLAAVLSMGQGFGLVGIGLNMLQFMVLAFGFTWMMAGNPPGLAKVRSVRTLFRLVAGSAVVVSVPLGVAFWLHARGVLMPMLERTISTIMFMLAGGDAVRLSLLEQNISFERLETYVSLVFRGGMLVSVVVLFFVSRQMVFLLARLLRKRTAGAGDLPGFFAPRRTLRVLFLAVPVILLGRALSMQTVEIVAWNVLVVCGLVFLAQGGGIVLFNIARRSMPLLSRVFMGMMFVVAMMIPIVGMVVLGALIVLGIAENWLPLRAAKRDAPESS